MTDDAARLLVRARSAAAGNLAIPQRHRARVGAWLGRAALETLVIDRLEKRGIGSSSASMRTRLSCLEVVDQEASEGAAMAWAGLSRACHHHAYELSASAGEVNGYLELVEALLIGQGQFDRSEQA